VAQLVLVRAADAVFFELDLPPGTDGRGEGGFGSSGA
jgi:dUTPase